MGVEFGINPLNDRVYIYDLTINGEYQDVAWRRRHFVSVVHSPGALGAAAGVEIKRDISTGDQEQEQLRWQHPVPESEVDRSIREYWAWVASEHAAARPAGPGVR